jgi:hypothetical protein
MKKTGSTFEKEVFLLIRDSPLKESLSGGIYRDGMRPFNSDKEDAVISFLTGIDGQFQKGIVNINIFVPDIEFGGSNKVKNIARCNQIEELCQGIIPSLKKEGYRFSLDSLIQTFKAEETSQHFVNVKLRFDYVTF